MCIYYREECISMAIIHKKLIGFDDAFHQTFFMKKSVILTEGFLDGFDMIGYFIGVCTEYST
jgi:hypothetical protein